MRKGILFFFLLLVSLSVAGSCIGPLDQEPDAYECSPRVGTPSGFPPVLQYYWIKIPVKFTPGEGESIFTPTLGIKFPLCINVVAKAQLVWQNINTHNEETPYVFTRKMGLDNLMDNEPQGIYSDTRYTDYHWNGFRYDNDDIRYPDFYPDTWRLRAWYLVGVASVIKCPWILTSTGGIISIFGEGGVEYFFSHTCPFKIVVPTIFSYGGDPVVNTFDGINYEFQGLCSYILTMDCNKNFATNKKTFNKFKVIGVNKPCDLGSCLGSVIIYVKNSHNKDVRIDLFSGFEPLVNGTKINLLQTNEYVFNGGKLSLSVGQYSSPDASGPAVDSTFLSMFSNVSQEYVRLETDSGFVFMWNGIDNLIIPDQEQMRPINTCGLLGNLDGIKENDMRYPDGSIVSTLPSEASNDMEEAWIVQSFVHHWVDKQPNDPDNCKSAIPRVLCDGSEEKATLSKYMCHGFIRAYQANPKCNIDESSVNKLHKKCVHDMCFCYNNNIFSCAHYIYHALDSRCH